MEIQSAEQLTQTRCVPCEGGVPKFTPEEADEQIKQLAGWEISHAHERIKKSWKVKNFLAAMAFFEKVAEISEAEAHHPDLHLVQYRNVTIELWTHAIGGLSANDFICAAKIDELPVDLQA
jgi:4a-hydroxytetrahydrobiopterin dehydratase